MIFKENVCGMEFLTLPLQCVFHSIRFKVNKGWSTAVLHFFCYYESISNLYGINY